MTLVVGRTKGKRVSIVADTLITEHSKRLKITEGLIKSCALSSGICVSFSGSPELAKKELWEFNRLHPINCDFADAVSYFEESSRRTENEYLLAFSTTARLIKIVKGKRVEGTSNTQWIGDKDAYEAFRQYEGRARNSVEHGRAMTGLFVWNENEGSPSSDLYSIMRQVVFGRAVESVGGLVSILSNHEGGFRPPAMSDMLFDWPADLGHDADIQLESPISINVSGENKEQSLNIFATGFIGLTLIGYYFLSGRTALLFHPETNVMADTCTVIRDVEPNDIAKRLNDKLGADWRWQMLIGSPESAGSLQSAQISDEKLNGMRLGFKCHCNTIANPINPSAIPPMDIWLPGPAR
jgi:hypothetical protein